MKRKNWLIAAHIPGVNNTRADALSRALLPNTEWALCQDVFDKITDKYPWLEFDLFASRMNKKFVNYASWFL